MSGTPPTPEGSGAGGSGPAKGPEALFRRALLDRLASPEQLNHAMRISDAKSWLALVGCAVIVVSALVWGWFGHVPSKVVGSGILLHGSGLGDVVAVTEGQLVRLEVEPGSLVAPGQTVARLGQPALRARIGELEARLAEAEATASAGPLPAEAGAHGAAGAPPSLAESAPTLRGQLARLRAELEQRERVVATEGGRVVEVRASVGDLVGPGTPIVSLERTGERAPLGALVYVDSRIGKALRPGMTIELAPSVVRRERWGVLVGHVTAVDAFPATRQGMMRALRNDQLVESLAAEVGGSPLAVRAELERAATPSGYRWSSGTGPEVELTSGTRCAAEITTHVRRPIALIFSGFDGDG